MGSSAAYPENPPPAKLAPRAPADDADNRQPTRYAPALPWLGATVLGILIDRYALPSWWLWLGCLAMLLPLTLYLLWRARPQAGQGATTMQTTATHATNPLPRTSATQATVAAPRGAMLCLLLLWAVLAGLWHQVQWSWYRADDVALLDLNRSWPIMLEVEALAAVCELPPEPYTPLDAMPRGVRSRLPVQVVALRDGHAWHTASGKCELIVDGHLLGVTRGDRLRVTGKLALAQRPKNPGEFDYFAYARTRRSMSTLWVSTPSAVEIIARGSPWHPGRGIDRLRAAGQQLLVEHIAPERYAVASALLLGMRDQLAYEQTDAYFRSGMVHVMCISGLHVGLLALGLLGIARLVALPRRWALLGAGLLVVLYVVVVGGEPPAVRAMIVIAIAVLAGCTGRCTWGVNLWCCAALVVLLLSPADLFRTGVQLSFLAAAALTCFMVRAERRERTQAEVIERRLMRDQRAVDLAVISATSPWRAKLLAVWYAVEWPVRSSGRWLGKAIWVSTMLWLVTLPLVSMQFHITAPVALLLGPLLALPVAAALLSGLALLTLGVVIPPLAAPCGAVCDALLALIDGLIQWGAALPGGHHWLAGPPNWWVILFYALLLAMMLRGATWPSPRWLRLAALLWCLLGVALVVRPVAREPMLRCTFLAVGHGAAVVLELPDGRVMLYDAGQLGSSRAAARVVSGYLWSRRIGAIDAVVVSHADIDHFNALPQLMQRFPIGALYLTQQTMEHRGTAVGYLLHAARAAGVPLVRMSQGDYLVETEGVVIRVLHPPPEGVGGSDNANSLVLLIEYQGQRILLTGDLESPGLERLLAREPQAVEVLMAPHHGSARSNPPGMIQWSRPRYVVVSSGLARLGNAAQGEAVAEAFRGEGAELLHTSLDGAVSIEIDQHGLRVESFLSGQVPE